MSLFRAASGAGCTRLRALTGALTGALLALPAAGAERVATLMIPGSDLSQSLLALGRQAQLSIVFPKDVTESVQSGPLEGTFSVSGALDRLIGDACLSYSLISDTLIAVREGCGQQVEVASGRVAAQTNVRSQVAGPGMEEIIVRDRPLTGSRIRVPSLEHDTQSDIIGQAEIDNSGAQAVGELLRFLPSVAGNSTSTLVSNGGDGTATVTLRGLPASNTLVLINGRRTNPDAFLGRSVDLNTVPLGLVERIEVLKDGASAIYGSDAIAGVVNLITRNQPGGLRLETSYGGSSRGDLNTTNSSVTYGGDTDIGSAGLHTNLGVNYYRQDPIYSRDRQRSRSSDDRDEGGVDKRSSATAPARITLPDGPVILAAGSLDGSDPAHFRPASPEDLFEYRDVTVSVVPSERWSLFADFASEWDNDVELYAETLFTRNEAINTLAQTPLLTGFERLPLTVAADNVYNPFGIDVVDVRRRMVELPPREETLRSRTRRLVAGVTFPVGSARWDLSVADNQTDSEQHNRHLLHALRTQQALGPANLCGEGCVPLNVFGPPGSVTGAMLDFLEVGTRNDGTSELRTYAVNVDFPLGQLPGGTVEVASGVEYREEALRTDPDPLAAAAETIGGPNFGPTNGQRRVWEGFTEVLLPVANDVRYIESLEVQLATRFSHYSDFGQTWNPKIAVRYRPVPSTMLRWSYSSGFRAPTLHQLFTSATYSFDQLNDPCAVADPVGELPGCTTQSDPTLTQFLTVRGGDDDLEAERASTITAGLVLTPGWLPALRASFDFYWISARDVVDANAQFIVNENARSLRFADRIERDTNGNLTLVTATALNIGERDVRGLDLRIVYSITKSRLGDLDLALNATHIRSFRDRLDPGSPARDQAGTFTDEASSGNGALPDWKANVGMTWRRRGWQLAYTMHFVSELEELIPTTELVRTVQAWRTHNVQLSYLGPLTNWTRVSVGANNLWDEEPPYSAAAFNDSYDARTYDITGRYVYAQVVKDL